LLRFLEVVQGPHALLVAIVTWLGFGLSDGLNGWLIYRLSNGLSDGLCLGASYALISLALEAQTSGIHLTERMKWTWQALFNSRHLRITVLIACISIIFIGLSAGLGAMSNEYQIAYGPNGEVSEGINYNLSDGLSVGLSAGLINGLSITVSYWLLLGLIQGTTQEQIEDQDRRRPNQGIHRSLRNGTMMALIGGGIIGIIGILGYGLRIGLNIVELSIREMNDNLGTSLSDILRDELTSVLISGLIVGLLLGISGALMIFLLTGGLAAWRHYIIRSLLWRSRNFPWKAKQFLDDATACFLLKRVGGGYSFSHRLLLDHLADAETGATSSPNTSSTQFPHP
jgi:hypothetical protein